MAEEKQLHDEAMEDGAEIEDGWDDAGWDVHFFLFLVGVNPIFNPTLYNPTKNVG